MRPITREEIEATMDIIHGMGPVETQELMERLQSEQPFLQVYIAAICERGDFDDENDADAFVNLATIAWYAMCRTSGETVAQVSGDDIDQCEERVFQLYAYAEGEPESSLPSMVDAWMGGCRQHVMLGFLVDALMSPENAYGVTEDGSGLIFTYVKTIVDALDRAG